MFRCHLEKPGSIPTRSYSAPAKPNKPIPNPKLEEKYRKMQQECKELKRNIKAGKVKVIEIDPKLLDKALSKAEENHKRSIYG